jgi:hypothetical protein
MNIDNKLINDIEKRMRTLMIGSIARFEESFGYLWKHGDEPSTKQENLFRDKWEDLRYELLNHGNHQIRSAVNELRSYVNNQNKYNYSYNFVIKPKNKEK